MADFQKATYEDLDEEYMNRLNKYLSMSKDDLKKIPLRWVMEDSINEAENIDLEDFTIIEVSPIKLIKCADMLGLSTEELFTNDISDFRYVTTLERWEANSKVDPPTVYVKSYPEKTVSISDGRHRAVLAYYLNVVSLPIIVSRQQRDIVNEILKI